MKVDMKVMRSATFFFRHPGASRRAIHERAGRLLAGIALAATLGAWSAGSPSMALASADSTEVSAPSPRGALLRSAFYPGWGQLANGKPYKACVIMAVEAYLAGVAISADRSARDAAGLARWATTAEEAAAYEDRVARYEDRRTAHLWWLGAAILYSMLDAYVDANLAGVRGSVAKAPPVLLDSRVDAGGAIRLGIAVTF